MALEQRVKEIIRDELGVEDAEVIPGARFTDDLGADSLDVVELVMRLEEEFGIEIPEGHAEKLRTVGDAVSYIDRHAGVPS